MFCGLNMTGLLCVFPRRNLDITGARALTVLAVSTGRRCVRLITGARTKSNVWSTDLDCPACGS